jgi:hypothetical protein
LGVGANDSTPEKFTVTKPWRRPRPTQDCSASKEEELLYWRHSIILGQGHAFCFESRVVYGDDSILSEYFNCDKNQTKNCTIL